MPYVVGSAGTFPCISALVAGKHEVEDAFEELLLPAEEAPCGPPAVGPGERQIRRAKRLQKCKCMFAVIVDC